MIEFGGVIAYTDRSEIYRHRREKLWSGHRRTFPQMREIFDLICDQLFEVHFK